MNFKIKNSRFICCAWLMLYLQFITVAQTPTKYSAAGNVITGLNGGMYNNRPLYCNNTNAFILSGDKSGVRGAGGAERSRMHQPKVSPPWPPKPDRCWSLADFAQPLL